MDIPSTGIMATLANRKFAEWTDGLDPHQSRISIFEHIRDIPYSLSVPPADPLTVPDDGLIEYEIAL